MVFIAVFCLRELLTLDSVFATEQDRESSRGMFQTIHNQVFNKEDKQLADILTIKPKKVKS